MIYPALHPVIGNKLAYPAGRAPGFDATHPAAAGVEFSGIAVGSGFINLLNGSRGTINGTVTGGIDGRVGPNVSTAAAATNSVTFTNGFSSNPAFCTIAGICTFSTTSGANQLLYNTNSSNNGVGLAMSAGPILFQKGGQANTSGPSIDAANIPYFAIASCNDSVNINFLLMRLDTGKLVTSTVTDTHTAGAGTAQFEIANTPGNANGGAKVATAMMSNKFMSIAQMIAFASDPWAFWFPRIIVPYQLIVGKIVAATRIPLRMRMGMGV